MPDSARGTGDKSQASGVEKEDIKSSAKRWSSGLMNFVPAVAYHFCLGLPAAFTQPGARLLQKPCTQKPHDGGSHGES